METEDEAEDEVEDEEEDDAVEEVRSQDSQQDNNNYVNLVMCDMSMLYFSMCNINIGYQTQV